MPNQPVTSPRGGGYTPPSNPAISNKNLSDALQVHKFCQSNNVSSTEITSIMQSLVTIEAINKKVNSGLFDSLASKILLG